MGAYTLLGLAMDTLSGQLVDLVEVLGAAGRRLADQLREAASWRQRFGLLDQFWLGRLAGGPRPAPEVAWAWQRLVATGGCGADRPAGPRGGLEPPAPAGQVPPAGRAGAQDRGPAGPLDGVWRRMDQARRPLAWGQVAADVGYADQAHLVRDFHQFTGLTPTQFQAQTLPHGKASGRSMR